MSEMLYNVVTVVVMVAITIIVRYAVPWLKLQIEESQYAQVIEVVEEAVRAAEQTIRKSGQGTIKKERVVEFLHTWLKSKGITMTYEQIDNLIEAAVYAMNHEEK